MTVVTYVCADHAYVASPPTVTGNVVPRPWVEVSVSYAGSPRHRVLCLVDTGADDTILDRGTASALGIIPARLTQLPVTLGSGRTVNYGFQPNVDLFFLGSTVSVVVLFGPVHLPLLGRSALFGSGAGLEIGFDDARWQHT